MVNIFTKGRILVRNSVKFCFIDSKKKINIFWKAFSKEKNILWIYDWTIKYKCAILIFCEPL